MSFIKAQLRRSHLGIVEEGVVKKGLLSKRSHWFSMGFYLLKVLVAVEIVLLFIQFWLGLSINLFAVIPVFKPSNFSNYVGGTEVLAHIINGLLILALAGFILSYGYRLTKSVSWLVVASIVFVATALTAGFNCFNYLLEEQTSSLSMTMAISFLISFMSFIVLFNKVDKSNFVR